MTDASAPGTTPAALRETPAGHLGLTRSASVISVIRHLLFLVSLPFLACCHESGTWRNDATNWKRAFGEERPKTTKVTNSWFWRSPHFTHEFEYFFAVAPNDAFRRQLIDPRNLLKVTPTTKQEREQIQRFFHEKPPWFIPKPIESYEVWQGKPPEDHFRLFIDRQTGDLFLTHFSV